MFEASLLQEAVRVVDAIYEHIYIYGNGSAHTSQVSVGVWKVWERRNSEFWYI